MYVSIVTSLFRQALKTKHHHTCTSRNRSNVTVVKHILRHHYFVALRVVLSWFYTFVRN